jgi:hypothetical protein
MTLLALVVIGAIVASAALGLTLHRHSARHPVVLAARSSFVVRDAGSAHPRRDADEATVARPAWKGLWARPMWKGGGRHPVWRGCQHVYDPKLGKFIFSGVAAPRD